MALTKQDLTDALVAYSEDVADGTTAAQKAADLATIIDDYIKTALVNVTIPAGTFIVSVSGGGGNPAVGVPNVAPVTLAGDPDGATGGLS